MASFEKLDSGGYRGIYYVNGKKERTHAPHFATAREAKEAAEELAVLGRRQVQRNEGTLPARIKWDEWCKVWWPDRRLEKSTQSNEGYIRDGILIPQWGEVSLNEIKRKRIQRWVNDLADEHSANYTRRIYGIFRASILAAVAEEILDASPCVKIRLPAETKSMQRHLEQEEYDSLLECWLKVRTREAVEFLWETGIRPGELAGLHWDQISLTTGWMTVRDVYMTKGKAIKPVPKDDEKREVPLTTRAIEILTKWKKEIPPGKSCGIPHVRGKCRSDLVFRLPNGSPLNLSSFEESFRATVERARLAPATPYSLRHSFGTRLAEAKTDPWEISRLMGHASLEQTTTYVHQTAAARRRFLAAMGDPAGRELRSVTLGPGTEPGTRPGSPTLSEDSIREGRNVQLPAVTLAGTH